MAEPTLRNLTSDSELSCRLVVFGLTGVFPSIPLFYVVDDQPGDASLLLHLVLVSRLQDDFSSPPVHRGFGPGELTAEGPTVPFFNRKLLELSLECNRESW